MTPRTRGTILAMVCVSFWALIPVVASLGQKTLDHHQFLFWSSLVSFTVLATSAIFTGRIRKVRCLCPKDWLHLLALGLLGTYVYYLLLYLGYSRAIGMEVLVLQYTWPILMVLFSIVILKERVSIRKLIALTLGFAGVVTVLTKGEFQSVKLSNPGVIALVGLGAACFALFSVLSKNVKKDPLLVVAIYFFCACIASFVSMLFFSEFAYPTIDEIIPILINGLFVNGLSYLIWLIALKSTEASYLAPFTLITPVLSAIYLVVFFDEPFLLAYSLGLVCIVAGGLVNSLGLRRDIPT